MAEAKLGRATHVIKDRQQQAAVHAKGGPDVRAWVLHASSMKGPSRSRTRNAGAVTLGV